MTFPLPYVYLPKLADQQWVIGQLWDMGIRRTGARVADVAIWPSGAERLRGDGLGTHPWFRLDIYFNDYGAAQCLQSHQAAVGDCPYVLTNSARHFVDYVRRMRAAQGVQAQ